MCCDKKLQGCSRRKLIELKNYFMAYIVGMALYLNIIELL